MVAYEYYWRDEAGIFHSIGIVPERRGNLERVTDESILNFGRIILGEDAGLSNLIYSLSKRRLTKKVQFLF